MEHGPEVRIRDYSISVFIQQRENFSRLLYRRWGLTEYKLNEKKNELFGYTWCISVAWLLEDLSSNEDPRLDRLDYAHLI